jgi:uncharacterized membrane protein YphA (DoxX/SURF4 family)
MKSAHSAGLVTIRIALGTFFVFEALNKLAWFTDSEILSGQLAGWLKDATPINAWYLRTITNPYAWVFARLVPIGEFTGGLALIFGFWTRVAATLLFLMVLNFHFASGILFQYRFLTFGYGLPVLGPLLGLAIGGSRLPWSVQAVVPSARRLRGGSTG